MSKHTPGPWVAVHQDALRKLDMMEIADLAYMRVVPAAGGWPDEGAPEADAALMAAAPELLALLKELREQAPLLGGDLGARVDAAIAKAEGQQ